MAMSSAAPPGNGPWCSRSSTCCLGATPKKNVEFGLEVQGMGKSEREAKATETLKTVGLDGFAHYFPHQLSGGMKQRVGLARALTTAPAYLMMDEPLGALDPQIRELMQIELLRLLELDRKTVVFVTHSVDEAIFPVRPHRDVQRPSRPYPRDHRHRPAAAALVG